MYTGIVQGTGRVTKIEDKPGLRSFVVELPPGLEADLDIGASIGIDGVCLTVVKFEDRTVRFDAMGETQERTTLGSLREGDWVNVERSARAGDEVGGHQVSGHVDGAVEIVGLERPENNHILSFGAPPSAMRYIFPKGFIALHGCSLTVVDVDRQAATFTVHLIPETLRLTNFDEKDVGDRINFEIDRQTQVIVDTVRAFLEEQAASGELEHLLATAGAD
jgi:riboflavin synthase